MTNRALQIKTFVVSCVMSNEDFVGRVVISKHGHDKGKYYVIVRILDDKFLLVANGENRPLLTPKRKNIRHIFVTKNRTAATSDSDIKKALKIFSKGE